MGKIIGFFGGSAAGGTFGGSLFLVIGKIGLAGAFGGIAVGFLPFVIGGAVVGGFIAGLVIVLTD